MFPDLSGTALPDLLAPAWSCSAGYIYFADREQSQGSLKRNMYAYRALGRDSCPSATTASSTFRSSPI